MRPELYHILLKNVILFSRPESTRSIITKYRTGSHNLRIQVGRRNRENRGERLCTCGDNIQTLEHVLFNCRFTKNVNMV